jgi:hypothetical protein
MKKNHQLWVFPSVEEIKVLWAGGRKSTFRKKMAKSKSLIMASDKVNCTFCFLKLKFLSVFRGVGRD